MRSPLERVTKLHKELKTSVPISEPRAELFLLGREKEKIADISPNKQYLIGRKAIDGGIINPFVDIMVDNDFVSTKHGAIIPVYKESYFDKNWLQHDVYQYHFVDSGTYGLGSTNGSLIERDIYFEEDSKRLPLESVAIVLYRNIVYVERKVGSGKIIDESKINMNSVKLEGGDRIYLAPTFPTNTYEERRYYHPIKKVGVELEFRLIG